MAEERKQRDDQRSPVEAAVGRLRVRLPIVGEVCLPPPDQLAYLAAIGLLAVVDVIEWPVALVIITGRMLATQHLSRVVKGIGEAFEEA
jgi:hypothetical protein